MVGLLEVNGFGNAVCCQLIACHSVERGMDHLHLTERETMTLLYFAASWEQTSSPQIPDFFYCTPIRIGIDEPPPPTLAVIVTISCPSLISPSSSSTQVLTPALSPPQMCLFSHENHHTSNLDDYIPLLKIGFTGTNLVGIGLPARIA